MHIKGTSYSKISVCLHMTSSDAQHFSKTHLSLRECRNHPDESSMVPGNLGLVALQAAGTELLVVGDLAHAT